MADTFWQGLLYGGLIGLIAGAWITWQWFKTQHQQYLEDNVALRHNIQSIKNFEDLRLVKDALGDIPILRIEDLRGALAKEAANG